MKIKEILAIASAFSAPSKCLISEKRRESMEYGKDMKRISGDSVLVETADSQMSTLCKTVGGTTYVVRINYNKRSKINVEDKLLQLMGEEIKNFEA